MISCQVPLLINISIKIDESIGNVYYVVTMYIYNLTIDYIYPIDINYSVCV